jgi:5-methyltetrahydropteroyltriglutamate--homocysteine methyltransferase
MTLPTEPIGSIPRSGRLQEAMASHASGRITATELVRFMDDAVEDTLRRFEGTGSPIVTDGEQRKQSFATYPIAGMSGLKPGGVTIPFKDGHTRQLPVISSGPFRYHDYAVSSLQGAKKHTSRPVKQAVISASAMSLLYPQGGIPGYSQEAFTEDVISEAEADIRKCLDAGADSVQIDFTEARLSVKLDPSRSLLRAFVALNNRVLEKFTAEQRQRIGVHTCPGGDQDSTHSADIPYASLLPELFRMKAGRFYLQLSSEADRTGVLALIREHAPAGATIFVGVTDPISRNVETPEQVRDRILEAAKFIDPARLGTTDDCGFSPFGDDTSTSRDVAFAKISARVAGNALASRQLGI